MAALEAQLQQQDKNFGTATSSSTSLDGNNSQINASNIDNNSLTNMANFCNSPENRRKHEQKKRWKTWGWKYSPGGKTSSIEEEPESPKHSSSISSKTNSPKHSVVAMKNDVNAFNSSSSPYESPINNNHHHRIVENRSSAGARLCQLFDSSLDETDDELQALIINGRPASVHVVSSNGGKSIIENEA